ncbi:MAG: hypothetical protein R3A10_21905 [Caldilineaceae bacterium]
MPVGIGDLATGTFAGLVNGLFIAHAHPALHRHSGHDDDRGLSLIISGVKPIYFNDTPGFRLITMGSAVGSVVPAVDIPSTSAILFSRAGGGLFWARPSRPLHRGHRQQQEATRLSGVNVANWKTVYAPGSLFSSLAGVVIASRLSSAQPTWASATGWTPSRSSSAARR